MNVYEYIDRFLDVRINTVIFRCQINFVEVVQVVRNQTADSGTHRLMKYRFDPETSCDSHITTIASNAQVPNRECKFGLNCQKPRCRFEHPPPPPQPPPLPSLLEYDNVLPMAPDNVREVQIVVIFLWVDAILSVQVLQQTGRVQKQEMSLLPS